MAYFHRLLTLFLVRKLRLSMLILREERGVLIPVVDPPIRAANPLRDNVTLFGNRIRSDRMPVLVFASPRAGVPPLPLILGICDAEALHCGEPKIVLRSPRHHFSTNRSVTRGLRCTPSSWASHHEDIDADTN